MKEMRINTKWTLSLLAIFNSAYKYSPHPINNIKIIHGATSTDVWAVLAMVMIFTFFSMVYHDMVKSKRDDGVGQPSQDKCSKCRHYLTVKRQRRGGKIFNECEGKPRKKPIHRRNRREGMKWNASKGKKYRCNRRRNRRHNRRPHGRHRSRYASVEDKEEEDSSVNVDPRVSTVGMTVRDIDAERAEFYRQQAEDGEDSFMYPDPAFDGKRKAAYGVEEEDDEMESDEAGTPTMPTKRRCRCSLIGMLWMHRGLVHARYVLLPRIQKAVKKLVIMWRIFILLTQKVSLRFALWVMLSFLAEQAKEINEKFCRSHLSRKRCKLIAFIIPLMRCTLVAAVQPSGTASKSPLPAAAIVVGAGIATAGTAAVAMNYSRSNSDGTTNQSNTPPTKRRRCRSSLMGAAAMSGAELTRNWRERQRRKKADDPVATSNLDEKRKAAAGVEEEDVEMESDEAGSPTMQTKQRCRTSSLKLGAAAVSAVERKRKSRERQKRKADEQDSCSPGEQDHTEVDKKAMSAAERKRKSRERQKRKAEERACNQGEQDGMEVDKDEDELEDIASGLDEVIQECVKECQEMLGSTQVAEGTYQARVCVLCDRIIKVSDPLNPIPKERLLQFKDKISVKRYEEHYQRTLKPQLKEQYQVTDEQLHGLLLSPRSRCREDGRYDACCACHRSLASEKVKSPPRFSIANGFVIGSIPEVLRFLNKEGKEVVYRMMEERLTDLLCATIAVVRPFGYVFSYSATAFNSIKGHITFFDMDQQFVGGVLNKFQQIRKSNIFCVLCGRMTPNQKEAVRRRAVLDTTVFLNLLTWFIKESGHPAYSDITPPDECPQPHVIVDPDNEHNTNREADANNEECTFEGNSYYFSSNEDPQEGTSVFNSTKMFVKAMLNGNSPSMFVYGGKYTNRRELKIEDICPIQFPYGLGGPGENRECNVSQEECLKHYLQLSLRQFMRGDFILIAYHIYNRIISYETGVIKSRSIKDGITLAERASKLTEKDVIEAGQRKAEDKADLSKDADQLLKDVTTSSKSIGHSAEAAKDALRNALALSDYFGCHAIFATVTPDDLCTFRVRLRVHAGEKHTLPSLDGPKTTADGANKFDIDFRLRSQDRLNYPGACAMEYEDIIQLVIKVLFRWDKKTQTGKKGIVGELLSFGDSTEEQCRKSLHSHFTLWVKDFNKMRDMLFHEDGEKRERARELMLKYVDKVMCASYGDDFKMLHSCNSDPPVCKLVSDVLHADEFPPTDDAAQQRLEKMRRARHKDHCYDIDGRILSCKECGAEFSPTDIINNVMETWQVAAQQEATSDQEWSPVEFPLTKEHLDVAAYRFSSDFDIASRECKSKHDHPLFNDFRFRKTLLNLNWNEHAATHCRTCFKKDSECRFFYPQPTQAVTAFDDGDVDDEKWKGLTFHKLDGSKSDTRAYTIVPARHQGSQYLNTHSDAMSMCIGCNTNIQIGDPSHTFYTTCYAYKDTQAEDSEMYMKVVNQITKHLARRKEREEEEMKRSREAHSHIEEQPAMNDDQPPAADDPQAAPADTAGRAAAANEQQPAVSDGKAPADDCQAPAADDEAAPSDKEDRASFIAGLSLFLSAFYATTSRFICSSPLAHYIMMNGGTRFIFSHKFVEMPVVQMMDVLEGKGTRYRFRKTKSKKGEVKLYPDCCADNYRYRPPELEQVCFYDQLMRYERHFYTFKEIDGGKSEEMDGDDTMEVDEDETSLQPNKEDNPGKPGRLRFSEDHPGYEFAYLKERKLIVIPRVSLPEGQLCPIRDLILEEKDAVAAGVLHERRESYAKLALIMFCPFRTLSDLQLNGRYWDRFVLELDRIQNPQEDDEGPVFWPKGVEILQNIDTRQAMEKLPRPDDVLKRSTEGVGDCKEKQKDPDPFVAGMGEFDNDLDRDPFLDTLYGSDDIPLSFGGIIDRAQIQPSHLKEVIISPGASSVFISDDDGGENDGEDDASTADEGEASEQGEGESSQTQGKPSSNRDSLEYATVLEFLCGSVVGDACYSDGDDNIDDQHKQDGRYIGSLRLPTLKGVAEKVEKKEGKKLDKKQYIAYEILCCSFILELVESGELEAAFAIDSGGDEGAKKNKENLIANLQARCAERNLTMFLTGPAGSGKSTAVDVAQRYCYEVSLALNITWDNSFLFTSTTGSSAALFGGVTIHSAAGMMKKFENIDDDYKKAFQHVRLLIVDEISYFSVQDVRKLDRCLKRIRSRTDLPFGGLPIVFCGDFHQLLPVSSEKDHVLFSTAKGNHYWKDLIKTIVVLENKHRFKDDPAFGDLLTRMWKGEMTDADLNTINNRVIGRNGLKLPPSMDGDVAYACPLNNERNSVNRSLFTNHVQNSCPKVTSKEEPPAHTVLIEAFIHSESTQKGKTKKGKRATTRVPSYWINCILTQCGDSDVRNGSKGGGVKIDPVLPCYPGAQMMATNNKLLKKLGVGNGTVCTVVGIKLKDGARMKWKNWDGRKVNTVLATEVEYILLQHCPAETPKIKTLQSKIDGLEGKDNLSEAEQKEVRNLKALLGKEKEARYFKLKPQTYTAEVSVSICPEVVRNGKTTAPFRFLQFPLNTNDATTGHKLQGMSKDHLIVTSWDGIGRWDNWAYTVISRVRKLEGLFLCKPLNSSVSFDLPDDLRDYERFMVKKEQNMIDERERKLKELKDRNADLKL